MKSRPAFFIVAALAVLISTSADCGGKLYAPEFVSLPDAVGAHVFLSLQLVSVGQDYDSARYIVDWGDGVDTTGASLRPADTADVSHVWQDTGQYEVRTRTLTAGSRGRLSAWSAPRTVQVIPLIPNCAPVIDSIGFPPLVQPYEPCTLVVCAHDPDGDSLGVRVGWGTEDTFTGLLASPCTVRVIHVFTRAGTAMVLMWLQDCKGTLSPPETVYVLVHIPGGVEWCWQSVEQSPLTTSALVANDGEDEVVMSFCPNDCRFYSVRTRNGKTKKSNTTRYMGYDFSGHAGLANGHIIVGSNEGELYALTLDGLSRAWQWPDKPHEESLTHIQWGAPAFNGDRIYIGHDDDSLFLFEDGGSQGNRIAAYGCNASVVDAPVIDVQGNVYFGTDSGYLYKVGTELDTLFWRTRLVSTGEIHSPIIGSDGMVYCASESLHIYAIDPATGIPLWTVTLVGEPLRPALGQTAIFVGTSLGEAYSINPATGTINWRKTLSHGFGFSTAPTVAANSYVYIQDEDDVLYCINQADGTLVWHCHCKDYLPGGRGGNSHRPRWTHLTGYAPNPTISANGNIIVVGKDALYCVAGYPEGPLDPLAPWPKWQHDLYNTGYVGGGR